MSTNMFLDLNGLEVLWSQILLQIQNAIGSFSENLGSVETKANKNESDIETINSILEEKASVTDVTNLQNNKADKSTVETIQNDLSSKANQSDLASKLDTTTFNTYVEDTGARLAEKADASSLTELSGKVTTLETNKQATITGGASTITDSNLAVSRALVSDSSGKVAVSAVTSAELGHLGGVTANIQEQLAGKASTSVATTSANGLMSSTDKSKLDGIATGANKTTVDSSLSSSSTNPVQNKVINTALSGKQATITGAATTITSSDLTASRALVSDADGKVAVSTVTSTKLGYLADVTSNIQAQLNAKAATDTLTDLDERVTALEENGTDEVLPITKGGTGLTAAPSMQINLASTSATNIFTASPRPGVTGALKITNGGTGATTAAAALTNLGAAPAYQYSTTDLTAGSSTLATGTLYFVYEE